ncbi:hypothetical protein ESCOMM280M3_25775 [Escherichia coli]
MSEETEGTNIDPDIVGEFLALLVSDSSEPY